MSGLYATTQAGIAARLDGFVPRVLVTLGSGLGELAEAIVDPIVIPNADVWLPDSTVPGHAGRLLAGNLAGVPVLAQQGRVHLYEGVPPEQVTACVRAAATLGVRTLVVTNAAGGLDGSMGPGDLMALVDHLNLTGTTPLVGPSFLDMADAYDPGLRGAAVDAAEATGTSLREGVYAGLRGPAFETPAEVRMLRTLGADAVGMSTVLEVLAAREAGLKVVGFSLITNVHGPGVATDHADVLEVGRVAGPRLAALIADLLPRLDAPSTP